VFEEGNKDEAIQALEKAFELDRSGRLKEQ
jgi:predicted Ser/Thr protein kinase